MSELRLNCLALWISGLTLNTVSYMARVIQCHAFTCNAQTTVRYISHPCRTGLLRFDSVGMSCTTRGNLVDSLTVVQSILVLVFHSQDA